jgi:hypothetical protein
MGGNVMGTFVTDLRGADPDSDARLAYDPPQGDED